MKRVALILILTAALLGEEKTLSQEVSPFEVTRLSLNNSGFSDISPVIFQDGLIFCSDRRLSGVTDRTSFDNRRLYNLYIAEKKDTSDWRKPMLVKSERSSQFNAGPFCIAPNGRTIYFTSEIETGAPSRNRRFKNKSGIFEGELNGMQIIAIRPFKYNSPDYNIGQPSISPDGKILFFASDMPGGQGGTDVYYCEEENGNWSPPKNMGPGINSPSTDNYPCIPVNGKLYFASNRPGGRGGLDIYTSDNIDGSWDIPVRLSEPINSPSDDFAFVALPDLQTGYFASNRRRNDDVYEFKTTIIRKASCNPLEINNYCYEFVEENAVKYDTIPFLYEWNFGDGNTSTGRIVEHCYAGPGSYLVQLDVTNMVTKEKKINEKSQMLVVQDVEQPYISSLGTAEAGLMLRFSADSTNLPGWDISRYYWNFGDETIAVGKNVEKSFRRPGTYNIQLIVSKKSGTGGAVQEACVSKEIVIKPKP